MLNIRTVKIDFTKENILPDDSVFGYQGEHNATTLSIVPPAEMTECEEIVAYKVAFGLNNCRHTRSEALKKASPVEIVLSAQITSSKEISVQLEGYGTDGNLVVKSPKVEKLIFEDSVGGVSVDYDGKSGTAADITANTLARHTHENADVLNGFGIDESGNLIYKGSPIGGGSERPTAEYIYDITNDGASLLSGEIFYISSYSPPESLTPGTQIKDIQFENNAGEYISIKNLVTEDGIPYIPLFDRCFDEQYGGGLGFGEICVLNATQNWVIAQVTNMQSLSAKIIYYI